MQLNLTEKSEIQNSGHETQTYERQFNPATNVKHKLLCGYAQRNSLLGLLLNHIMILAPALPQESTTSHNCTTATVTLTQQLDTSG